MSKPGSTSEQLPIAGLGPHGERAVPFKHIALSDADAARARDRRFTVAVVLHTTASDWARQQLAGIVTTLGRHAAVVVEVVDCQFRSDRQNEALKRLAAGNADAIISIPIGNTVVGEAHHMVSRAGKTLVMLDNVPTGLLPGTHYASVVSADNFGLGQIAAHLLSHHVPDGASVGLLTHGVDFFVTNEREIAFRKWMARERPDLTLRQAKFRDVAQAAAATGSLLDAEPELAGLFVVWDEPAMTAAAMLRARGRLLPMTTIDLGNEAAIELAGGGLVKGIGAQQPYDQGRAAATAALLELAGRQPPPWIALPGLAVTADNVLESYQIVWHAPAPPTLVNARRSKAVGA